ncbi:rhomboid family-domain-containing protein [Mycotypha africana]|uniref:rhomboid family-domain-containing protein n=1 Tax=Mycotypha africana TaxID=64632 RepID=UPI0023003B1F|nr:rhomboid family-domain-containing protein [Mycotypha africana]KAI8987712.1 rhomboid family-domain-containing protein [Mycotypha africana]
MTYSSTPPPLPAHNFNNRQSQDNYHHANYYYKTAENEAQIPLNERYTASPLQSRQQYFQNSTPSTPGHPHQSLSVQHPFHAGYDYSQNYHYAPEQTSPPHRFQGNERIGTNWVKEDDDRAFNRRYGGEKQRNPITSFLIGPVRVPIFSYVSATVMVAMLIYEFVRYHQLTGGVIEQNPFNPMIGPSFQVLVNTGARFTPCIRSVPSLPSNTTIGNCYRTAQDVCTLEELCGFNEQTGQSFRFVLPIIMHAGVIHFLLNMLTHLRLGVDLERALGTVRYFVLYACAGIYGFILSAMLSQNLTASTGCSGALFGLIGYMFIDVLVNWKFLPHPIRDLMGLLISTIISLVLGLLPGLDNFAHVGGFAVGIFMGMLIAPMRPMATRRVMVFTWMMRIIALVVIIVLFTVSLKQFYSAEDPSKICPNCKYLSCLPVNGWCDV